MVVELLGGDAHRIRAWFHACDRAGAHLHEPGTAGHGAAADECSDSCETRAEKLTVAEKALRKHTLRADDRRAKVGNLEPLLFAVASGADARETNRPRLYALQQRVEEAAGAACCPPSGDGVQAPPDRIFLNLYDCSTVSARTRSFRTKIVPFLHPRQNLVLKCRLPR